MADEVVKTIENVDRLFSEIVVNGESHVSENYVPPVHIEQVVPQSTQEEETQSNNHVRETQGADVYAIELNSVQHDISDRALTQSVRTIQDMIPNQASSENQLADKNFVNSSIATNTANFLGTYTSLAEIEALPNPTNNDYAFLETTDSAGNTLYDRYKYSGETEEWLFEYELNNSGFTAEQWATINSGLTQSSVTQEIADAISALPVGIKMVVSTSQSITASSDLKIFIDTANITLTLNYGSTSQYSAEIYAIEDCTVEYYTDANTVATLNMEAGTRATLLYFNGWKNDGVYGAVWN